MGICWRRSALRGLAAALALGVGTWPGLALADVAVTNATFAAQGSTIQRITSGVRMTKDEPVPTRGFAGPNMLADPSNPRIIVAASVEMRTRVCYLMRSTNAGKTWHILSATPALTNYPFCFSPFGGTSESPIAWGRNGALYYGLNGWWAQGGEGGRSGDYSVLLARSTNLGNSWTTSFVLNNRGKTGAAVGNDAPVPSIAVDSRSGTEDSVYVSYDQSMPNEVPAPPFGAVVASSTNAGQTFSLVNLNNVFNDTVTGTTGSGQATLSEPHLAVGAGGTVFGISTVSTPRGIGTVPSQPMELETSTDHGKTWSFSPVSPAAGAASEPVITWIPQGGVQGTLVVAYQYKASSSLGNSDIFVQRSTDGGKTWSPAMRLNDDPANGAEHALPNIDAAPNGRIDVVWYDFRRNLGFAEDVDYSYSTTAGATWSHNVRVNDQPINLSLGISANSDVRQPPGVASANQEAVIGWADPRLANATDETQDDFSATAQFAALPATGNQALPYVAAIFGGLAAAGIVLIVLLRTRSRRPDGSSPDRVEVAATTEGLAPEA